MCLPARTGPKSKRVLGISHVQMAGAAFGVVDPSTASAQTAQPLTSRCAASPRTLHSTCIFTCLYLSCPVLPRDIGPSTTRKSYYSIPSVMGKP
jgi:hypothetical protein